MKAIISTRYGMPDVLRLAEIETPRPEAGQVLIRVMVSSVTTADTMMRTGYPLFGRLFTGLRRPRQPVGGTGFAGVVEAVGAEVTRFSPGDRVFGESVFGAGSHAQYVCIPQDTPMVRLPENVSYVQAAPLSDGALTAFYFLRHLGRIEPNQKILINGASGGLGSAAVQLAKLWGARVTAVCSSANHELVRQLGAEQAIDYTQVDFARSGEQYDLIFDTVGKRHFREMRPVLRAGGRYLSPVLGLRLIGWSLWTKLTGGKKAMFAATGMLPAAQRQAMLDEISSLLAGGQLRSVIDRQVRLEQIADAHRHIETGHKRGNVVVMIGC